MRVVNIKLLVSQQNNYFDFLKEHLIVGNANINKIGNIPCILIGTNLADALHILPSDTVHIIFAKNIEQSLLTFQLP
jgi:hypothetical protein